MSWSVGDLVSAFDDDGFQCDPQSVSSSAAVLQYFDWRTYVFWQRLYATAQDIQNVVEYESIELSGLMISEPQTRGSQFSSHILHLLFSRPYLVRSTVLSRVALMLQCCVCRLSVCTEWICGYTVRPRAKVTIDSLWEVVYKKSIGTKMNDLDLCLEVV